MKKIKKRVKKQKGFSKTLIGALQSLGQFSTQSTQIGMNKMVQSSLFWFVTMSPTFNPQMIKVLEEQEFEVL